MRTVAPHALALAALSLANSWHSAAAAEQISSPVGKVIELMKSLLKQVEAEGKKEAATYEKFSCFCKSATETKSKEVAKSADKIDEIYASIESNTAETKSKQSAVSDRKDRHERMSAELDEESVRCRKEAQRYDSVSVDIDRGIIGIRDAIRAMKTAKKATSLLDVHSTSGDNLDFSRAVELAQSSIAQSLSFLQVDPQDPEYKFQSGNIVAVLHMLERKYGDKKKDADAEWTKTDVACKATKDTLKKDIKNNNDATTKLDEKIEGLAKDIAKAKENLVSEQTSLQDAQEYLKDLNLRCEARAKDWDQRTQTRKEEVNALSSALQILEGTVKAADKAANKRALLLSARKPRVATDGSDAKHSTAALASTVVTTNTASTESTEIATELSALENNADEEESQSKADLPSSDDTHDVAAWLHGGDSMLLQLNTVSARKMSHRNVNAASLRSSGASRTDASGAVGAEIATELTALQNSNVDDISSSDEDLPPSAKEKDVSDWLHSGAPSFIQLKHVSALALQPRKHEEVLAFVQQEARRLGSSSLSSLAHSMSGDPFSKVKGLIQQLLERLLKESASEATKKGFCDEELGKARQERDYNFEEAQKLNAEIESLEARKERLDTEVDELKDQSKELQKELDEAKKLRAGEKTDNAEALAKAKEGLDAVREAYNILKSFYKNAGAASFVQASPVDEDAPDAPEGGYKGKQGASQGILGLLQVIISDFDGTLRKTEEAETKAAADFEEFKQNALADLAGQETKRELNLQDSKTAGSTIRKKLKDVKFAMGIVDANLKTLDDLKPTCQDSGRMSYKERTEKREQEMEALKQAMCKLDTEGVEAECK